MVAIAPSERVLWQGNPSGYPVSCWPFLVYGLVILAGAAPYLVVTTDLLSTVLDTKIGLGTITITVDSLGDGIETRTVPVPFVGLVPVVLVELLRVLFWRDRSYWITDRRVIEADRAGNVRAMRALSDVNATRVGLFGSIEITSEDGRIITFEALDRPDEVRAMLEQARMTRAS